MRSICLTAMKNKLSQHKVQAKFNRGISLKSTRAPIMIRLGSTQQKKNGRGYDRKIISREETRFFKAVPNPVERGSRKGRRRRKKKDRQRKSKLKKKEGKKKSFLLRKKSSEGGRKTELRVRNLKKNNPGRKTK